MKEIVADQTGEGIYFASKINSLQKHTCSLERVVSLLTEEKSCKCVERLAVPT